MTKTIIKITFLFFFTITGSLQLQSQEVGTYVKVKTKSGNTHFGLVGNSTDSTFTLEETILGKLEFLRKDIKLIRPAQQTKDGSYWTENSNPYNYFLAPSAYAPKKGEAYYQNSFLFLNTCHFGLTDHITVSGGFELASVLLDNASIPSFLLATKVSLPVTSGFHLSGSFIYTKNTEYYFWDANHSGLVYIATTFGNPNSNISFGYGRRLGSKRAIYTINGLARASSGLAIISENWILPGNDGADFGISLGTRFIGDFISIDIAIASSGDQNLIPWFGFSVPF